MKNHSVLSISFVCSLFFVSLVTCYPNRAVSQGTVTARTLILSDSLGHTVEIIPSLSGAPGSWIYEIPDTRVPKKDGGLSGSPVQSGFDIHGPQNQQAAVDNEPYITFAAGTTKLTDNRILSAGSGISLTNGGVDNAAMTVANTGVLSLTGTTNQVNASASTGAVTLSLPQNIHTGATPQFTNVNLTGVPASSAFNNIVVSNGGVLQTRTIASLGHVNNNEPILTFSNDNGSLTNNRVVSAGSGISVNIGAGDGTAFTIANTGVTNVGLSLPSIFTITNPSVTTTGVLTAGLNDQTAATFFAAPAAANGQPSFRSLTTDDFQNIVWTLDGNSDITGKFIGGKSGSYDPLDMRVNGTTRFQLNDNASIQRDADGFNRGFYAVDLQNYRNTSNHVASGNSSTIGGGRDNRASAAGATVGGGGYDGDQVRGNLATAIASTIAGGHGNEASVDYSSIGGGDFNSTIGYAAAIAGGQFNTAADYGSSITGGIQNSAIGESTFIGGGTQNSATYAKSVIGGGNLNTASGAFSVILGGESNTADGDSAAIGGGSNNSSTGVASVVAGGTRNNSAAIHAAIGGGSNNAALGNASTIGGGEGNSASSNFTTISGGYDNSTAAIYSSIGGGYQASTTKYGEVAQANGSFANRGDAQRSEFVLRSTTTDSNFTELFLDGAALRLEIPNNTAWTFMAHITGLASNGDAAAYEIMGLIKNITGTTSIVGTVQMTTIAEDIAGWDVTAVADNTNDALSIKVQGALSTTIRWAASVRTTQVTY